LKSVSKYPSGLNSYPRPRPRVRTQTRIRAQRVRCPRICGFFLPVAILSPHDRCRLYLTTPRSVLRHRAPGPSPVAAAWARGTPTPQASRALIRSTLAQRVVAMLGGSRVSRVNLGTPWRGARVRAYQRGTGSAAPAQRGVPLGHGNAPGFPPIFTPLPLCVHAYPRVRPPPTAVAISPAV